MMQGRITWSQGKTATAGMPNESAEYHNRFFWEVCPDGSWRGKPAILIGGGPSLCGFNWERLRGWRTIGVNRVYEKFDPTIIFSMDLRYLHWIERGLYGDVATRLFNESKAYKVWLLTYMAAIRDDIFVLRVKVNYQYGHNAFTLTQKEGLGHGNNSGYAALNLACCLGANPIYLLGYDMKHSAGRSHWHEGHPSKQAEETVVNFREHFNHASRDIKRAGFDVVNLNPDSALKCFRFGSMDEVLG
jgi:hypothetical protein